jgi:hypothetical protein
LSGGGSGGGKLLGWLEVVRDEESGGKIVGYGG